MSPGGGTESLPRPPGPRKFRRRPFHSSFPVVELMAVRGIRGAISVSENSGEEILSATRELLRELCRANGIDTFDEVISAIFTTTPDLTAVFPAEAARGLGMNQVPLLCASEIAVPHGMRQVIRILLHINTERSQAEMVHVYLREARKLRPDVSSAQ